MSSPFRLAAPATPATGDISTWAVNSIFRFLGHAFSRSVRYKGLTPFLRTTERVGPWVAVRSAFAPAGPDAARSMGGRLCLPGASPDRRGSARTGVRERPLGSRSVARPQRPNRFFYCPKMGTVMPREHAVPHSARGKCIALEQPCQYLSEAPNSGDSHASRAISGRRTGRFLGVGLCGFHYDRHGVIRFVPLGVCLRQ
jgi:hypothetical protein